MSESNMYGDRRRAAQVVLVAAKNFEVTNRENLDFGAQRALERKV
jgi:hypothetical protein